MRWAEQLLLSWLANALALIVAIAVLHDVTIGSAGDLLAAAVVFGLLNTFLKPILKLLTLPLAVITLRLIWFVVAAFMLKLTALIIDSFDIHGIVALFWATLIVWAVNLALDILPGPWRGTRRD
jgi:putative membrane protein